MTNLTATPSSTAAPTPLDQDALAQNYILVDVNPNVSRAEDAVRLVSSGALGIDSESNLIQVANMIIDLSPQEKGFLFDRLSNQDLQDFGEAMLAKDFLLNEYGLEPNDRLTFFSHLAKDLPGGELARIGIATGDPTNMAKAVASHAPDGQQVLFVEALAPQVATQANRHGSITTIDGNGAANAVAEVLSGVSGQHGANAFGSLTRAQLDTVMEAAQGEFHSTQASGTGAVFSTGYRDDAQGVKDILNGAANIADSPTGVDHKARAFVVGVEQLNDIRGSSAINKDAATDSVLDGLTNLLKSNPTGILTELRGQASENTGNSLSAYARTMFVAGRSEELGEVMGLLKQAGGADLVANFTDPSGGYENARNLGYFTNAITQGLDDVASARGTLMRNIDALGGGIANILLGSPAPWAGVAIDEAIAIIAGASSDGFADQQAQIADSFRVLAWPVSEVPSGPGQAAFEKAVDNFNAARVNN